MKRKQIVSSMVVLSLLTSSVPAGVYAQEGLAVNEGVSAENRKAEETKDEVKEEPKEEIKDEVKEEPKEEIKDEVKEEPKEEVKDEVKEEPKEEIKDKAKEEPKEEVKDEVKEEQQKVAFENPYEGVLTDEEAEIIEKDQSELSLDEQVAYIEAAQKLNGGIALMSLNGEAEETETSVPVEHIFLISSGEQLNDLAGKIQRNETYFNGTKSWAEASFELVGDISLSKYEYNWIGIGTDSNPFKGTFDGNGYTIADFESNSYSLFNIAENAAIKNFTIDGYMYIDTSEDYGHAGGIAGKATNCIIDNCTLNIGIRNKKEDSYTGGAVGYAINTQITNCTSYIDMDMDIYTYYGYTGGIAGKAEGGKIENCVIENGDVNGYDKYVGGIAGYVSDATEIKNCSFTSNDENSYVWSKSDSDSDHTGEYSYAGGIAGYVENSTIENCYTKTDIKAEDEFAGGIAGKITGTSNINNCYALFNRGDEIRAEKYTGGITGYIEGGTVENCYSSFEVYADNYTGGISGYLSNDSDGNTGRIMNCYTTASVDTYEDNSIYQGGIAAFAEEETEISNCVYMGEEICSENYTTENLYMNRIANIEENTVLNNNYAWEGTALKYDYDKAIEVTDKGTDKANGADIKYSDGKLDKQFSEIFTGGNWIFEENKLPVLNMGTEETSDIPEYMTGYIPSYGEEYKFEGEGTEQNPYIISSLKDLEGLRDNVNNKRKTYEGKFFKQTADIDMSELEYWYSIGFDFGSASYYFKGTYDGDNHKISNMYTSSNYNRDNWGFFRDIEGTVKNLTLENCEVENSNGVEMAGILARCAKGATIVNCHVINGKVRSAGDNVGGLIGNIYAYENDTVIKNCSFEGEVIGNSNVGGIVGTSEGADISECYFKGNLTGGNNTGGILGYVPRNSVTLSTSKKTTIKDCYTKVALTGSGSFIGGILGRVQGEAEVTDCYVTGTIKGSAVGGIVGAYMGRSLEVKNNVSLLDSINVGTSPVGRILGYDPVDDGLTLKDNYAWAGMRVNGNVVADSSIDGKGFLYYKGELGKQLSDVFTNKDVWTFEDNKLPVLKNISNAQDNALPSYFEGHLFEGEGTEQNPYIISSYDDLAKLSDLTNSKGETFSGKFFKQTADIIYYDYYNSWIAIKDFEGTYDGNGKTIVNVLGIFNNLKGTVKNLNMENIYHINDVTEETFGVLANITEGKIINCHVKNVNINANNKDDIGLITGELERGGLIENCSAEGEITGRRYLGGIAGKSYGKVKGCTFKGKLIIKGDSAGGIVGDCQGTISNCSSSGEIENKGDSYYIGGIVGTLYGNVNNCYSTIVKSDGMGLGGIAGRVYMGSPSIIENCYYLGKDISNGKVTSGIVSHLEMGVRIKHCMVFLENISGGPNIRRIGCGERDPYYDDNYAWSGMKLNGNTVTDGALNNDNGADVELVDGKVYYNNAEFDWEANGFTEENGWVLPSRPYEMPKLKNDTAFPVLTLTQQAYSSIKINETPQVFTYGDENIKFAVKDVEPNTVKDGFKVEYLVGDTWTENAPVNAGKYNVKVSHDKVSDDVSGIEKVIENGLVITVNKKNSEETSDPSYTGGGSSSGSDKKYTIKFETDGGNTIEAEKTNGKITEPKAPEKEGYTFDGWYTDKELTKKFDFDKAVSGNVTLYAKWTENAEESIENKQIILTINEKEAVVFGNAVINDVAPVIVNGRTMLPIRFIAEALGATVDWNDAEKKVTIKSDDKEIVIYIGSDTAYINGVAEKLDVKAFIKDNRTYLPLRFISENLGADVQWIAEEKKVVITKK